MYVIFFVSALRKNDVHSDNVQMERFHYAPKRNEAVLLVRIDVIATISQ